MMLINNIQRRCLAAFVLAMALVGVPSVAAVSPAQAATRSCSASTSVANRPLLRQGDKGSCVKELQRRLNKSGAKLVVDGDFGPATRSAVLSYQRSHRLAADGLVGKMTWSALVGKAVTTTKPKYPPVNRAAVERCWQTGNKVWLTFDDGGTPAQVNSILATLKKKNVKAYFFFKGNWAKANPSLMKKIKAEGHYIGNHTFDHPSLPGLSDDSIKKQIRDGAQGTSNPKLLRPPYGDGAYDDRVNYLASQLGYKTCYWTVDSRDWSASATTSSTVLRNRILYGQAGYTPAVKPGGIVLMHGHGKYTASALPSIIDGIRAKGMSLPALR